jgi:hypothetical protein
LCWLDPHRPSSNVFPHANSVSQRQAANCSR